MTQYRVVTNGDVFKIQYLTKKIITRRLYWAFYRHYDYNLNYHYTKEYGSLSTATHVIHKLKFDEIKTIKRTNDTWTVV